MAEARAITKEERALAVLESIEEIKPPSILKWHIIYFLMGAGGGVGVYFLVKLLTGGG